MFPFLYSFASIFLTAEQGSGVYTRRKRRYVWERYHESPTTTIILSLPFFSTYKHIHKKVKEMCKKKAWPLGNGSSSRRIGHCLSQHNYLVVSLSSGKRGLPNWCRVSCVCCVVPIIYRISDIFWFFLELSYISSDPRYLLLGGVLTLLPLCGCWSRSRNSSELENWTDLLHLLIIFIRLDSPNMTPVFCYSFFAICVCRKANYLISCSDEYSDAQSKKYRSNVHKERRKNQLFGFVFAKSDEGKLVLIGEVLFKVAIDISPLTLQTLLFRFDFLS